MKNSKHILFAVNRLSPLLPISPHLQLTTLSCNLQPLTTQKQGFNQLLNALDLLKAAKYQLLPMVQTLHCLALKLGALPDLPTSTTLLTFYARANSFCSSCNLFEEMPLRDVIAWNAMITASVRHQHFQLALDLFNQMWVNELTAFDSTTLLVLVSAVSRMQDVIRGHILHCLSLKHGMVESDCYLGNALVDMYAKCGDLSSAECVFEGMQCRDVSSWNSVISGCLKNGFAEKALCYFMKMSVSVQPDDLSLSCSISACSPLEELHSGQALHGYGIKLGYGDPSSSSVGNALISFYSQCGDIDAAEAIFRGMIYKDDAVSWNSMIHAFVENELILETFALLHEMQFAWDVRPDSATLLSILTLCGKSKLLRVARSVHGLIVRREMGSDLSMTNSMMDVYSKCNVIESAEVLFETISTGRDLISWNTMIAGYSQNDLSKEAQILFCELLYSGHGCSIATVLAILSSCNSPENVQFGKSLHGWQLKLGFSNSVPANNSLMFMYIKTGELVSAFSLLRSIPVADVISWNTVIVGYVHNGHFCEAVEVFNHMRHYALINPDSITLVSVLSTCGNLKLEGVGAFLHGLTLKTAMESDIRVRNALITMYSRCEDIESARLVFTTSPCNNLCSWNCVISGFAQNKRGKRALELFRQLEFEPNEITIVSVLSACTQVGVLGHGMQIHAYVFRYGLLENPFILASLVDMYSKCGRLDLAVKIFKGSPEKSTASWNSIISAYGCHGYGSKSIQLFIEMCESGIKPTKSTFVSLLSACSHSGLVEEGQLYFNLMPTKFAVEPTLEHYVCIVDMLGRNGRLEEAYKFIKNMPVQQTTGAWGALLSACKYHVDVKMGKQVAEHLFNTDPENVGYYISLFNTYAAAGRWSDAMQIRRMIQDKMLTKAPGYSLIEVSRG